MSQTPKWIRKDFNRSLNGRAQVRRLRWVYRYWKIPPCRSEESRLFILPILHEGERKYPALISQE